jgi:8-hydroxy-5-deazaflavin:NADPH oxidoreductase
VFGRDGKGENDVSRRDFLRGAGASAAGFALVPGLLSRRLGLEAAARGTMKIGIIGAGRIGGAVGLQWAKAGHEILFSSRNPNELADLVQQGGLKTQAGLPLEAATFGDVVFVATPFDALPEVGGDFARWMRGKVVICCSNPARGATAGEVSKDAMARGSGVVAHELFPGTRVTRAFNAINFRAVESEAHRAGEKVGIPVCGDDQDAVRTTSDLVVDAGFDPVVVGGLGRSKDFDPGSPVFVTNMTAAQIRDALGLR